MGKSILITHTHMKEATLVFIAVVVVCSMFKLHEIHKEVKASRVEEMQLMDLNDDVHAYGHTIDSLKMQYLEFKQRHCPCDTLNGVIVK